jgi:hypothetical protein
MRFQAGTFRPRITSQHDEQPTCSLWRRNVHCAVYFTYRRKRISNEVISMLLEWHYYCRLLLLLCLWQVLDQASAFIICGLPPSPSYASLSLPKRDGSRGGVQLYSQNNPPLDNNGRSNGSSSSNEQQLLQPVEITGVSVSPVGFLTMLPSEYIILTQQQQYQQRRHSQSFLLHLHHHHHSPPTMTLTKEEEGYSPLLFLQIICCMWIKRLYHPLRD